jgi:hypothetical protein
MRQRLFVTLSCFAFALVVPACDAGTADTGTGSSAVCSSDHGCSSGYGCSDASFSTQATCAAGDATWGALSTEEACTAAGQSWRALLTESDCIEAGFTWDTEGGSPGGQACAPNLQQTCPCGGGEPDGVQACLADGSGWTPCDCGGGDPVDPPPSTLVGEPCETNGEEACDGERAVIICSGGAWLETEVCDGSRCEDAACLQSCTPDCAGRACGDDGCGESCGSCPPDQSCDNVSGQCAGGGGQCVPNANKQCLEIDGVTAVYWYDSCNEQGDWIETCEASDYCSAGACVEACQPHASKRCKGDNIYWYDSCGTEESAFQACEPYEYCIHQGATEAACLKGVYAGQWMIKAKPSDPMFYDNTFTLTEDSEANTVTFEELIPGYGTAYYTGELDGKLLVATGSYEHGGATYDITVQVTFAVPPDTNGVAPTELTGFWSTDPTFEGMSLGAIVTNIEGDKL